MKSLTSIALRVFCRSRDRQRCIGSSAGSGRPARRYCQWQAPLPGRRPFHLPQPLWAGRQLQRSGAGPGQNGNAIRGFRGSVARSSKRHVGLFRCAIVAPGHCRHLCLCRVAAGPGVGKGYFDPQQLRGVRWRRQFLTSQPSNTQEHLHWCSASLICAPAIVRATGLMSVRSLRGPIGPQYARLWKQAE